MENIVNILIFILSGYLLIGLLFAIAFVLRLANQIDPGAKGAHWSFRLMTFPGVVAFWPVLMKKYLIRK